MDQENQIQQPAPISPNPGAYETPEKGTKKSGKILPIILILVTLAGVSFGVYGMFLKPEPTAPTCPNCAAETTAEQSTEDPSTTPNESKTITNAEILSITKSAEKIFQESGMTYELSAIRLQYWTDSGKGPINYDLHFDEQVYIEALDGNSTRRNINLSGDISDVYSGNIGLDSNPIWLFLLEDGTVEYIALNNAVANNDFSPKKLDGLSNIIKFYTVGFREKDSPYGGVTITAQDTEGNLYKVTDYMN